MSVGTIIAATKSEDLEPNEWQKPYQGEMNSSKMVITFARNHGEPKKTIELSHASRKFADHLQMNGTVDLKNELVKKLAKVLTDSEGKGGYRAVSGEFMGRLQRKRKFK